MMMRASHWLLPTTLFVCFAFAQTTPVPAPSAVQPPPSAAPTGTAIPSAPPLPGESQPPTAAPSLQPPQEIPNDQGILPGQTVDQVMQEGMAFRAQAEAEPPGQKQTIYFAEAVKRFAQVYSSDPTNVEAMLQIGEISMLRNDTINGREYFARVIRIEGKNFRANRGMGEFYLLTRYFRQAVPFLEVAVEAAPADRLGETYRMLAAGYYETRYFDKALVTINKAYELMPNNALVADYRTRVLLTMVKLEEARVAASDLIEITRRAVAGKAHDKELVKQHMRAFDLKVDVLTAFHNSLHLKNAKNEVTDQPLPGKEQEIAKVLNEIVETRVGQLPIINTLALLDVVPLAQKAIQYSGGNPDYMWTLAKICVEARLFGDAMGLLEKILQVDPQNQKAREALAQLQAEVQAMQAGAAQQPSGAGPAGQPPTGAPAPRPAGAAPQPMPGSRP